MGPETDPGHPTTWNNQHCIHGGGDMSVCLWGFDGVSRHNSLFKLDLQTYQWEQVQAANPSSGPQKKGGCRMVSYGDNQLVIFAGRTESGGNTDELHVFNLDKSEYDVHHIQSNHVPSIVSPGCCSDK